MTGRDLIVYILQNGLEDEPVFKDMRFIGYITANDAAKKLNVGVATIQGLVSQNKLEGLLINGKLYISADLKPPIKQVEL